MSKKIVAQQDRRLVTPLGVDGRRMTSDHRLIKNVIVHERRRVDHLDDRRQDGMSLRDQAARFSGKENESRAQPFASIVGAMIDELLHERESTPQLMLKNALSLGKVRRDGSVQRRQSAAVFPKVDQWL